MFVSSLHTRREFKFTNINDLVLLQEKLPLHSKKKCLVVKIEQYFERMGNQFIFSFQYRLTSLINL